MTPIPEPPRDIRAQIDAVLDPSHPKRAIFMVPADAKFLPYVYDAHIVERPEGTLLTTDAELAALFAASADDRTMATILGYPEAKPDVVERCGGNPALIARAVQARDAAGNVITETFTSPPGLKRAVEALREHAPPGGELVVLTPIAAIARRVALRYRQVFEEHPDAVAIGPLGFKMVNYAKAVT